MKSTEDYARRMMALLRGIQGSLKGYILSSIKNSGFTIPQFMVLVELYYRPGISLNELSEGLDLPKSSVSRIVDKLVNNGVVIRKIPDDNRRTVNLSIEPDFIEKADLCCINWRINEAIEAEIDPARAEGIIKALEELNSILKCHEEK